MVKHSFEHIDIETLSSNYNISLIMSLLKISKFIAADRLTTAINFTTNYNISLIISSLEVSTTTSIVANRLIAAIVYSDNFCTFCGDPRLLLKVWISCSEWLCLSWWWSCMETWWSNLNNCRLRPRKSNLSSDDHFLMMMVLHEYLMI